MGPLAIPIWRPARSLKAPPAKPERPQGWVRARAALLALVWLVVSGGSGAAASSQEEHARAEFARARTHFETARTDPAAAWQLGRAAYELADLIEDPRQREQVAQGGIDACQNAISLAPNCAPAQYYLALNLGESARSKRFGALKLLHQMEHALLRALAADPTLDYGGPDRALGLLYLDAPSWPVSIGSRKKALTHLEAAAELGPSFLENGICLAEAYVKWGQYSNLKHELGAIDKLLPTARSEFTGANWTATWADWDGRITKLRKTEEKLASSRPSPPSHRGAGNR
jgi:hypothetical protein